jgi:hypothetical protein
MDILFLRTAINLGCIVYFETKSQPIKVHLVYHLIFIIYIVVLIRAIPFNIHTPPTDEVGKMLTPKKKSADTKHPSEI